MQKNIIYYYGVNENYDEKYAKISGADLEVIESNDIYDLSKVVKTEYFVLTLNCHKYADKNAQSRMFFLSKDLNNSWLPEIKKINFGYWKQIVINIQSENRYYNSVYNMMGKFADIIKIKDHMMPYHMTNVANLSVKIACYLGVNNEKLAVLYVAAIVHDLGKLYIPDSIINKRGKLDEQEFSLIKKHPSYGSKLVKEVLQDRILFRDVPNIIKHHHENFNGSGYPGGLSGKGIPFLSKIIRVADSVDAMATNRSYKEAYDWTQIMEELIKGSGIQYDPVVVDAALQIIIEKKIQFTEEIFESSFFIPEASLSFTNMYNGQIISITGNVLVNKSKGEFFINESDINKVLIITIMKKTMIAVICQGEVVEYFVDVVRTCDGKIYLENIKMMPSDKTFSMMWDSKVMIINTNDKIKYTGNLIKLGAETILVNFDMQEGGELLQSINSIDTVVFDELVGDMSLKLALKAKIVNYYLMSDSVVFVIALIDIVPSQKDRIIRILFKRQMEMKRNLYINSKGRKEKIND